MNEQFGCGFEGLEERTLLAANVTAVLSNGTLTITGATSGAEADDVINVFGDGTTGNVTIDVNDSGGTLAGDSDGVKSFTGVKNIVFNGGAGDDYFSLYDLSINGNVTANGGADDDSLYVSTSDNGLFIGGSVSLTGEDTEIFTSYDTYGYGVTIVKNVTMTGGAGDDYQGIFTNYGNTDIFIGGNVTMNGNGGSDYMEVDNYYTATTNFGNTESTINIGGNVTINGGAGNDYGFVGNGYDSAVYGETNIGGRVTLNGGDGNDVMGVVAYGYGSTTNIGLGVVMNGGNGHDRLGIASFDGRTTIEVGGGVTIHGNFGNDTVGLFMGYYGSQTIDVAGKIDLEGDQGDDFIGAINYGYGGSTLEVGSVLVQGWDGNDNIGAYGVTVVGKAEIWGGNGNDNFAFQNSTVGASSFINGWWGYDTLVKDFVGGPVAINYIENIINV